MFGRFVLVLNVPARLELHPIVAFGKGMIPFFRMATEVGFIATRLPGKVSPPTSSGQSGYKRRSMGAKPTPTNGHTSLKSPQFPGPPLPKEFTGQFDPTPRSAAVGTAWLNSCGVFSKRNSSDQKKYALSFFESNTPGM